MSREGAILEGWVCSRRCLRGEEELVVVEMVLGELESVTWFGRRS